MAAASFTAAFHRAVRHPKTHQHVWRRHWYCNRNFHMSTTKLHDNADITISSRSASRPSTSTSIIAYQDFGSNQRKVSYTRNPSTDDISKPLVEIPAELEPAFVSDSDTVINHFFQSSVARRILRPVKNLIYPLLPRHYPYSVSPHYADYTQWTFAQGILSSASGTLATQSLLLAVGVGQASAAPVAAALQWIIKDGFGHLGSIIITSRASGSFDSDPKGWRMRSAVLLDLSTLIEIVTQLVPHYFLILASIANIGKSIAWLTSGSARVKIHESFQREDNLADITAKAGTQAIITSLVGTVFGLAISWMCMLSHVSPLLCFLAIAVTHQLVTYRSLRNIPLYTINSQRGERINVFYLSQTRQTKTHSLNGTTLSSTSTTNNHQFNNHHNNSRLRLSTANASLPTARILSPAHVGGEEKFVLPYRSPLDEYSQLIIGASIIDVTRAFHFSHGHNGVDSFDAAVRYYQDQMFLCAVEPIDDEHKLTPTTAALSRSWVWLRWQRRPLYRVLLVYKEAASAGDILMGNLMAAYIRQHIHENNGQLVSTQIKQIIDGALSFIRLHRTDYLHALQAAHWNVTHVCLEDKQSRVRIHQT